MLQSVHGVTKSQTRLSDRTEHDVEGLIQFHQVNMGKAVWKSRGTAKSSESFQNTILKRMVGGDPVGSEARVPLQRALTYAIRGGLWT